jgi:hypothetical protein
MRADAMHMRANAMRIIYARADALGPGRWRLWLDWIPAAAPFDITNFDAPEVNEIQIVRTVWGQ